MDLWISETVAKVTVAMNANSVVVNAYSLAACC
jgi:hypothetical protein